MNKHIYTRQYYINKIRGFYNSDLIKVITGIRRCGKSCFLLSVMEDLKAQGIKEKDMLEIYAEGDRIIMKKVQSTCCFCDNTEEMIEFSGKYICPQCLAKLKEI